MTSNYYGKYSINANAFLAFCSDALFVERFMPDIVISIGGLTGDYALFFKLFKADEESFQHWRVSLDGSVIDTFSHLTRVYQMSTEDFFFRMKADNISDHQYYALWKDAYAKVTYENVDKMPLSNLYAAIKLSPMIPDNSVMNFAILNSFRSWCYVKNNPTVHSYCNLAAFGIDGCTSMFLGESVETDNLSFLITGDLAFFYDLNALGIRHIKNNVRILLCNNNGGMEFKFGSLYQKTDVSSYIAADNHFRNSEGWARTNGFDYIQVTTKEEFLEASTRFVAHSDKPIILEIITTPEKEREAALMHNMANMQYSERERQNLKLRGFVKNAITPILGESGLRIIRKVIKN